MKTSQRVFNLQSGHEYMVENGYVQCSKGNYAESRQPKLQFMCSACRLMVLYICVKFGENMMNGKLWSRYKYMVEMATIKG